MQVNLTTAELQVVTHALSIAAERFREDAKLLRAGPPGYVRLAETFEKQERDTLAVLTKMEEW